MMLIIFTIATTILIILVSIGIAKDIELLTAISLFLLITGGIICWALVGTMETIKATAKVIPKEKYEILIGEDKIVITNLYNKNTETFEDASRYNIITQNRDKYYLEIIEYNMYGYDIKTSIEVKDSRFIEK